MKLVKDTNTDEVIKKISDKDAEDAFRTILPGWVRIQTEKDFLKLQKE